MSISSFFNQVTTSESSTSDFGTLTLDTEPAEEAVTTTELKSFAKIDTSADDTLIGVMNTAARKMIEDCLAQSFVNTTFTLSFDQFPTTLDCNLGRPFFEIYRTPLSSVTSIQYVDEDEATQTLAATEYDVDTLKKPGRIVQADGVTWPDVFSKPNVVTVTFVAGHGAAATDVPEKIKQLIKLLFAHWYEHRESMSDRSWSEIPWTIQNLINQERVQVFR